MLPDVCMVMWPLWSGVLFYHLDNAETDLTRPLLMDGCLVLTFAMTTVAAHVCIPFCTYVCTGGLTMWSCTGLGVCMLYLWADKVSLLEEGYCLWEMYLLASPWLWAHVHYYCSPQKETYPHTPQQWHSDPWLKEAHTCLNQ